MKGLAWYSLIIIGIGSISLFTDIVQGINVSSSIWGIAAFLPVIYFAIKHIRNN